MGAEKLNSFTRSSYDYGFRRDAHQLLAWGYQDTLVKIHCNLQEEEITGLIAEEMEKRLDSPSTPEKFDRYSIDEEKPIAVEGRKGKKRRRLDLVVVRSCKKLTSWFSLIADELRQFRPFRIMSLLIYKPLVVTVVQDLSTYLKPKDYEKTVIPSENMWVKTDYNALLKKCTHHNTQKPQW